MVVLYEGNNILNVTLTPIVVPIAGSIGPGYIWYEGLADWEWAIPGREIALSKEIHLAPMWSNKSELNIVGHVDLSVTYPDGTGRTLSAVLNQDEEAAPGDGWAVRFAPFISSQEGTYTCVATLSSEGQVLDSVTFTLISVPAVANLYGVVTDTETGSPIQGVKVTLGNLVVYTDSSGNYGYEGLAPGDYTITFEKNGYETVVR